MNHFPLRPIRYGSVAITPAATSYTIALGATSVVRIQPSIDCWLVFGPAAVTPTTGVGTNAMPLTALQGAEYFKVVPGEVISIICNDGVSSGFISICEMSR